MKFQPMSEEEIKSQMGMLSPGKGNFEVFEAKDDKSKSSGVDMIKLTLKVWDNEGRHGLIFDYLPSNVQWKLKQFLESIADFSSYQSGTIDPQTLVGKSGDCIIAIQEDKTGKYKARPIVKSYVASTVKKVESFESILDEVDDVPF